MFVSETTKRAVTTTTKAYAIDVQVRVEIRRFVSRRQNAVDSSTAAILMLKKSGGTQPELRTIIVEMIIR